MMKRTFLTLGLLLLLGLSPLHAQNAEEQLRGVYERAETSYVSGRIEEAQQLLVEHMRNFSGSLRQSAYRLLALCALGLDDMESAEHYVRLLLDDNPYYSTTANDPQRFVDMVGQISGRSESTITTASSHSEKLSEVPVPTTLITEQMIRDSGARNLQEVLAAYVPGMSIVDCNTDVNIAMRGIFSSGQEKILIMLDGHRLNSYSTNRAALDFSMELDKLKQIEVLRGPASSLYGGVALTAVVNLITKRGADIDGVRLRVGGGSYGQLKGSALFGKRYYDLDMLIWASYYKADGEERSAPMAMGDDRLYDRKVTVGGIGNDPSYELGMTLRWKDFQLMYDMRNAHIRLPYTISTLAAPYDYDRYRTHYGLKPGFSSTTHHTDLKYGRQIGKLAINGILFLDNHDLTHYQVISDDTLKQFGDVVGLGEQLGQIFKEHGGTSRLINGLETTVGAQAKGEYNYLDKENQSGYLSFGAEYSHFSLDDVRYIVGYDFTSSTPENALLAEVGKGSESCYNGFIQLKHRWHSLILNAGLRYDHKVRFNYSRVNEYSPRLALIYVRPKWNAKLSYSKSFVDAPYWYQKMNQFVPIMKRLSTEDEETLESFNLLNPETLHSIQLTFAGTQWLKGLDFELNLFHNRAVDLISEEIITHVNSGKNKSIGAELMATYRNGPLSAHLGATWLKTLRAGYLYKDFNDNNNTPAFFSNLVLAWQATSRLKLHTKVAFQGRQTSYNVSYPVIARINTLLGIINSSGEADSGSGSASDPYLQIMDMIENDLVSALPISPRTIVDLGANYRWGKVSLALDIHNLLDKSYYQSGMNTGLVPQRGRWILGTIGLDL